MKSAVAGILVAGLVLAACSESVPPDSRTSGPVGPELVPPAPEIPGCDWRTARNAARAYFTNNSHRTAATAFLRDAESAGQATLLRNTNLFEVFKLVEVAREAEQIGDPADGAALVKEGLDCGAFVVTDDRALLATLTRALTDGAFAFRGTGVGGHVETEDTWSAVEPADEDWVGYIGGPRLIVFGAQSNAAFTEAAQFASYRWSLIYDANPPSQTTGPTGDDDALVIEFCPVLPDDLTFRVARGRPTGQAVLQLDNIANYCPVAAAGSGSGVLARALQAVAGLFAPTRLEAARVMMIPPGVGGASGGLESDFALVDPVSVTLTFTTPPTNGTANTNMTIIVHAAAANGTPLENAGIQLVIDGNQGTPGGAVLIPSDPIVHTDESGNAVFIVQIGKPGGYRLRATNIDFQGFGGEFVVSDLFNLMQP